MSAGQVDMVLDGLQALQYMDTHTKPDLILLDAPWDLQKDTRRITKATLSC